MAVVSTGPRKKWVNIAGMGDWFGSEVYIRTPVRKGHRLESKAQERH